MINAIVISSIIGCLLLTIYIVHQKCPKCNNTMVYMGKNKDTNKELWFCENCGTVIEK